LRLHRPRPQEPHKVVSRHDIIGRTSDARPSRHPMIAAWQRPFSRSKRARNSY
jgi:hypothetical protein